MRLTSPARTPALLLLLALLPAGCAAPGTALKGDAGAAAPAPAPAARPSSVRLSSDPAVRAQELEQEVIRLQGLRAEDSGEFKRRLASIERERDIAVAEVVRMRARMQGMVSQAEAGAMYAEARVLVDRMSEDAYSTEARESLGTARKRLEEGKTQMDKGNPGGAAFLFDQLSNIYEGFRKGNPRRLVVADPATVLRATPGSGGKPLWELHGNEVFEGVSRQEGWVQVKDAQGRKGWVPSEVVH